MSFVDFSPILVFKVYIDLLPILLIHFYLYFTISNVVRVEGSDLIMMLNGINKLFLK